MRKKVLIGLSAVFAAAFGLSCTDDETGPWKDYDLSVTSNIASGNGNVPYEGATVVFTVTTDGRWTYVTDDSAGWLGQSAVDGNTLAVVVPENTVSKERSGPTSQNAVALTTPMSSPATATRHSSSIRMNT